MIRFLMYTIFIILFLIHSIRGQYTVERQNAPLIWCTTSQEEQFKCTNFSRTILQDKTLFRRSYFQISCKQAANKEECMTLLDLELADITSLDAGEVFFAGHFHSLIPIMQEMYQDTGLYYYSVAVIKKGSLSDVSSLYNLRYRKACFPSVENLAGWVIPIHVLMQQGGLEVIDCNNHVKSAIEYFGRSCAINSLIDRYNPIGDNSNKLCELCIGPEPGGKCTPSDPYAGFAGAFRCLVEAGDIAFLKHTTVLEMTRTKFDFVSVNVDDFELLCKDGSRRPVTEYLNCNWGKVPTDALVVSSAKTIEMRQSYQNFLETAIRIYSNPEIAYNRTNQDNERSRSLYLQNNFNEYDYETSVHSERNFSVFESAPRYGLKHNLMLQDMSTGLSSLIETRQTYKEYLGSSLGAIYNIRFCPVNKMTLCVTSDPELEKCIEMMTAMKARLLKPEMSCYKGRSQMHCMQAIRGGNADVAVFDAGDVYTAGLQYDLIPFISEVYNLGTREYYVVAVSKEEDPSTELTYLKGKTTCHSGIFTGAGWIVPLAYLISNNWIRSYGCDSAHAASEYFSKSCVPGALSPEYAYGTPRDNLCHLCHGVSHRYCRRDASEDYYGFTGAFRCLVEGGGQVAFLKHTTVYENTDGKRKEWWARNALNEDFQLLCPDGTRSGLNDYERCSLGKVKANAIVTRGGEGYNQTELNAYVNLFIYAQQLYSRKDDQDFSFSMFTSAPPYSDLIFQDATQQLKIIEPERRHYETYLGKDFMRARRIVDCRAGVETISISYTLITLSLFMLNIFYVR